MSNKELYTKYDLLLPSKIDGGYLVGQKQIRADLKSAKLSNLEMN